MVFVILVLKSCIIITWLYTTAKEGEQIEPETLIQSQSLRLLAYLSLPYLTGARMVGVRKGEVSSVGVGEG